MNRPAKLLILTYHRVLEEPDPLRPAQTHRHQFERHLSVIRRYFRAFTLAEAMSRLEDGSLPHRSLAITFDDGYRDNETVALPMLQRFRLPATFFIATGYLDGSVMWNDRVIEAVRNSVKSELDLADLGLGRHSLSTPEERAVAIRRLIAALKYRGQQDRDAATAEIESCAGARASTDLMMSEEHVRSLASEGMEIGAHTVSHPILSRIGDDQALREMRESRRSLSGIIGEDIHSFAYPNGRPGEDFEGRHARMVQEAGFSWAATTAAGPVRRDSNRLQLGRFAAYGTSRPKFLLRLLRGYCSADPVTA